MVSAPVPAALCIDVEPDAREVELPASSLWSGFEKVLGRLPELRDAAGRAGSATLNWFVRMDPQIELAYGDLAWGARTYRDEIDALLAEGDEVGVHPHSWRWDERLRRWVSDQADESWVLEVLDRSLETFATEFGAAARIHRWGDRFMSSAITDRLSASGVAVDLTLEPGTPARPGLESTEASTGELPYTPLSRTLPYRAAAGAFTEPAPIEALGVTMAPLTSALVPGRAHPETLVLSRPPEEFRRILAVRLLDPDLRHLAFAMRSDLVLDDDDWGCALANLTHLAEAVPGLTWVQASSLALAVTPDGGAWSAGPMGGAASELAAIDVVLGSERGRRPSAAVRALCDELASVRAARDDADRRAAELAARTAEAELAAGRRSDELRVADHERALLAAERDALRHELDEALAYIAAIEATATWRARRRLLPVLEPFASSRRRRG
jgi:hypothetical protein